MIMLKFWEASSKIIRDVFDSYNGVRSIYYWNSMILLKQQRKIGIS